jgi:hypothetical protein
MVKSTHEQWVLQCDIYVKNKSCFCKRHFKLLHFQINHKYQGSTKCNNLIFIKPLHALATTGQHQKAMVKIHFKQHVKCVYHTCKESPL